MAAPGEERAVAAKTELKCKLCRHANRREIDDLLLKRSRREKDEGGRLINLEYVLAALRGLGVQNPTEDNIKNHWRKHVQVVSAEVVEKQEENRRSAVADDSPVDVDAVLDRIVKAGMSDLETLMAETEKSGVTVDQVLKATQIKTQRKQDEAAKKLIGGLAGAIGGAIAGRMLAPQEPRKQLDDPDVIEGEVVEVVEG